MSRSNSIETPRRRKDRSRYAPFVSLLAGIAATCASGICDAQPAGRPDLGPRAPLPATTAPPPHRPGGTLPPPITPGPSKAPPGFYIGDANDNATIISDSEFVWARFFANSDDDEAAGIQTEFDNAFKVGALMPVWYYGRRTVALVHLYDLVAPIDPARAGKYLERLRRMADVFLANRDDLRVLHAPYPQCIGTSGTTDAFRGRRMPSWGGCAADRDNKWNTDVVVAGLLTYPMAAFARRVTDNPALQATSCGSGRKAPSLHFPNGVGGCTYASEAIRFITATLDSYAGYRHEMHLTDADPWAYFTVPTAYGQLACNSGDDKVNHACSGYRDTAGKAIAYNENLSLMKALAEAAIAADSALYRASPNNAGRVNLAVNEAPRLIAKNFTFYDQHLRTKTLDDGTPYFQWDTQEPGIGLLGKHVLQDTAHAGFEMGSLATLLQDKVLLNAMLARAGRRESLGLSAPLFVRFANTFLRRIWTYDFQNPNGPRNLLANGIDGKPTPTMAPNENSNTGCEGWAPLAEFDKWVWTRCRDATFVSESFWHEDNLAALLRYRKFH